MRPDAGWAAPLAAFTLACVLAVIAASALVRLSVKLDATAAPERIQAGRAVRQNVGGLAALGVAALAIAANSVRATRGALGPAAAAALALTVVLSGVGFWTGTEPPPAAAFVNQFGGVLLAGILGWLLGRARASAGSTPAMRILASVALAILLTQAAFGGAIAIFTMQPPVVLHVLHAALGLAAAACLAAVAFELRGGERLLLVASAASVPLAGVLVAVQGPSSALQVAHSLAGAVLLAAACYARGRLAPT